MASSDVLRTLGGQLNSKAVASVSQPKVIVRNPSDLHTLRRAFQSVYNDILNKLSNEELNSKTKTALLLRFSQLENSVFKNVRKHTFVQTEEERMERDRAKREKNKDHASKKTPEIEAFDTALQQTVDTLEAKLQALVKEVDDMRKNIPRAATSVRSFADELENDGVGIDSSEVDENGERELAADFNKEIYDALARKVAMISGAVEELTDDVPQLISNSINDLQAAHELLNAPQSKVDIAMASELTKKPRQNTNEREIEDDANRKRNREEEGEAEVVSKTPRTTLRDMILND